MTRYRRSIGVRLGLFLLGGILASWMVLQGSLWSWLQQVDALPFAYQPVYAQSVHEPSDEGLEPVPVNPGVNLQAPSQGDGSETAPATADTISTSISLVGSQPSNDETDVLISSRIELQFSDMLDDSLDALDLTVEPAIPLQFNVAGDRIVLQPSEELGYSTQYTVTIPQQAALPLEEPVQFSFKTEPEFTYNIDVKPLLELSCVGCHGAFGTSRSDAVLDSYSGVLGVVEPGDDSSLLIDSRFTQLHARRRAGSQAIEQRYMRINGYPMDKLGSWSPEEIDIVTTWVVQDEAIESSAARQARFEAETGEAES
ncbi:MAG: Ig-like domain-containing protein [Cyanobacteria bacterium J06597_1]